MGKYIKNGSVVCFSPDDTDTKMYLDANSHHYSLASILTFVQQKWLKSSLKGMKRILL